MRLIGLAFALVLLCLCATAAADEPVLTYVFSGQATRGGEPVKQGTIIEARVGNAAIGATRVTDEQGNWSIEIDAGLFRSGICEAVFYIDGQQAGKQNVNCSVDLLLEVGAEDATPVGPSATTGDKPTGGEPDGEAEPNEPDSETEPSDTEDQPVDTDPVLETDTETEDEDQTVDVVDHQDDAENPDDELTADDEPKEDETASTTTALRPNVPGTGSGGMAESPPWTAWGVLAIPLASIVGWLLWRTRNRSFR